MYKHLSLTFYENNVILDLKISEAIADGKKDMTQILKFVFF